MKLKHSPFSKEIYGIMQAKFTYSPTGKVLVKQTNKKKKKIEEQGKKNKLEL